MNDVQAQAAERDQIRADLLAHKVPRRVLVHPHFSLEACCSHAGVSLMQAHYDPAVQEAAFESVCRDFYADTCPAGNLRFPVVYQILGAKNWILSSSGAVQHPEIEAMYPEDYDAFIADPYGAIIETFLPRVTTVFSGRAAGAAITMAEAYDAYKKAQGAAAAIFGRLKKKYGYTRGLKEGAAIAAAPFDFLADQLRGFKGISMDVRRMPDKVAAAARAAVPLILRQAGGKAGSTAYFPLHLAPYLNRKVFDTLYWPTLRQTIGRLEEAGVSSILYAEQDFTRYADALAELPESTIAHFETGDYAQIKKVFGQNHVMGGFFDPTMTLAKSREECIDAAKRLCDACMEGGRFHFTFDRAVMDEGSIHAGKLAAVLEWVRDNAVYG